MNQQQRNFIISRIENAAKINIQALEFKEEPPSIERYLLKQVLSEKFKIIDNDKIRKLIEAKAEADTSETWCHDPVYNWRRSSLESDKKGKISFNLLDLFVIPEEFLKELEDYDNRKREAEEKKREIRSNADGLITRIQLASNKVLDTLIDEVDDMGNISLVDTSLKALGQ